MHYKDTVKKSQWDLFNLRAGRIQTITYPVIVGPCSKEERRRLDESLATRQDVGAPLFPLLVSFGWKTTSSCRFMDALQKLLFRPTIRHLSLTGTPTHHSKQHPCFIKRYLMTQNLTGLKKLEIGDYVFPDSNALSTCLSSMPDDTVESVSDLHLSQGVQLHILSRFISLRFLHLDAQYDFNPGQLPASAFPCLQHFNAGTRVAIALLTLNSASALIGVKVDARNPVDAEPTQVQAVISTVGQICSASLESFALLLEKSYRHPFNLAQYSIVGLTTCQQLRVLRLQVPPSALDLYDHNFDAFVQHWTQLRHIFIHDCFSPPPFTIRALISLSKYCPNLETAEFPVGFKVQPVASLRPMEHLNGLKMGEYWSPTDHSTLQERRAFFQDIAERIRRNSGNESDRSRT